MCAHDGEVTLDDGGGHIGASGGRAVVTDREVPWIFWLGMNSWRWVGTHGRKEHPRFH